MTARTFPRRVTHRAVPPATIPADAKVRMVVGSPWTDNVRPRPARHEMVGGNDGLDGVIDGVACLAIFVLLLGAFAWGVL